MVVGLARSGVAAARLCHARGAQVTVTDLRNEAALAATLAGLPPEIGRALGGHDEATFRAAELIVVSPGVPEIPALTAARAAGVTVTGELELASRFVAAPMIGITGTNGKSTTTTLCGAMMTASGRPTFVGGNLGIPLAEAVGSPAAEARGVCVVEVSSFQLETAETFRPRVGVLLNITPDHLDRYPDIDAYAAAKERLFQAQTSSDFAVLNVDDARVAAVGDRVRSRVLPLSTTRELTLGAWVERRQRLGGEDAVLCVRLPGDEVERYPADNPSLIGRHNQENALAALLAARLGGAMPSEARRALVNFRALAHRMEWVGEVRGVAFFDDSKGTNVGATVAALTGFPRPVVLIAGGRDKGGSYAPLAEVMARGGRAAVTLGEAAARIETALAPVVPVARAHDMDEAVTRAMALAHRGDAVVLSPACSSFDMYRNYEHRAEAFRTAVARVVAELRTPGQDTPGDEP